MNAEVQYDDEGEPIPNLEQDLDFDYPSDDEEAPQGLGREEDALPLFDEEDCRVYTPVGQQLALGFAGLLGHSSTAISNPNVTNSGGGPAASAAGLSTGNGAASKPPAKRGRPPGRGHGNKAPAPSRTPAENNGIPATGTRETAEQRKARAEAEWTEIGFTPEEGANAGFNVPEFVPGGGRNRTRSEAIHVDDPDVGGPSQEVKLTGESTVLEYFELFFTKEIRQQLVANTNAYAVSVGAGAAKYPDFTPFSHEDIDLMLSLLMRNGLKPHPNMELWFKNPDQDQIWGDHRVRNMFGPRGVQRWKELRSLFHIQDPKARGNHPLHKLQPLEAHIKSKCMSLWVTGKSGSIDEQTIGFQGRHHHSGVAASHFSSEGAEDRAPKLTDARLAECRKRHDLPHPSDFIETSNFRCQFCYYKARKLHTTGKLPKCPVAKQHCRLCSVQLCGRCWNEFHQL